MNILKFIIKNFTYQNPLHSFHYQFNFDTKNNLK